MDLAAGAEAFGPQPVVLAFFSRPKAEIENDVRSQFQRPAGDAPEQILDGGMPGLVFRLIRILPEAANLPSVGGQTSGWRLVLDVLCRRRFP